MMHLSRVSLPNVEIESFNAPEMEELSGNLSSQDEEDKLMKSVLEPENSTTEMGRIIKEAVNQGINSFHPDMMFQQYVSNYQIAQQVYGESMMRLISGYDDRYIKRNLQIPEFQKEIKKQIQTKVEEMKKQGLLSKTNEITPEGVRLASLVMFVEEIDNITPKGLFGEREHKKVSLYGMPDETRNFRKGDRYADIALKKTLKLAIRRNHDHIGEEDLRTFQRSSKGKISIIYALDASGSMKGKKIATAKKAGVALAFKAISKKDKVGLIIFGSEVITKVRPTDDFNEILMELTKAKASKETNMKETILTSLEMFDTNTQTKHLLLLTDAMPTSGDDPHKETMDAVALARSANITISLVGINLNAEGEKFAKEITEVSGGKFYIVRDLENMDKIILEDYSMYS